MKSHKRYKVGRVDPRDDLIVEAEDEVELNDIIEIWYNKRHDLFEIRYRKDGHGHDGYIGIADAHEIAKAKGVSL